VTYDGRRASFDKEHVYIVEIDLDYCPLTHGSGPCTATETGDDKCFNTFSTCNDLPNYRPKATTSGVAVQYDNNLFKLPSGQPYTWIDLGFKTSFPHPIVTQEVDSSGFSDAALNGDITVLAAINSKNLNALPFNIAPSTTSSTDHLIEEKQGKTYRFCQPRSPHPLGINAIPSLKNVSLTPSKIDVSGGMGERSSVSLTFDDHPHNDFEIDKYTSDRTYIASDRGLFWTKFRARNPNYQFRALRVLTGYLENGEYVADNFKARHYVIEKMDVSGGKCTITAKDTLKKASTKKAQVPKPSTGTISDVGGINDTDTTINLEPVGVGDSVCCG
jgi:hypothetical protein